MRVLVLLLMLLPAPFVGAKGLTDEQASRLDSIMGLVDASYSTPAGMAYIDEYIDMSRRYGNDSTLAIGLEYKAGTYINMMHYDELDQLVDSIEQHVEKADEYVEARYYIEYIHAMSYIYRGQYRLAIHRARMLYDETLGFDFDNVPSGAVHGAEAPQGVSNRLCALRCLGMSYAKLKVRRMAIKYFEEALELASHYPDNFAQETIDINCDLMEAAFYLPDKQVVLGYVKRFDKALKAYEKTFDDEHADIGFFAFILQIAYSEVYSELGDLAKAEQHLAMATELMDRSEVAAFYIGNYYKAKMLLSSKRGEYALAMSYADSTLRVCRDENDIDNQIMVGRCRFQAAVGGGKYGEACDYADQLMAFYDSINEQRFMSSIEEFGTIVDLDKMQLMAQQSKSEERIWTLVALCAIFVAFFLMVCVVVYVNSRRATEKQQILSQQKSLLEAEVERQTAELRRKNKDITDSISYARQIQNAILPDVASEVAPEIPGAFTIYRPCEILSGDFYWAERRGDEILVACADCTGHGVPGSLMAMTGSTVLNEICMHPGELTPSEILEKLDGQIMSVLAQNGRSDVKDGMDIALVSYNAKRRRLLISSARRYVYLYKDGVLERIKGVRRSIADREEINRAKEFVTLEYEVNEGDMLYLTTDGFVDQYGGDASHGPIGERFSVDRLIAMLDSVRTLPVDEQKTIIEKIMDDWQGSFAQVDDMALVGLKF